MDAGERTVYEKQCRGEVSVPVEVAAKLKCRYINNRNPYLLLAPFKTEEAYLDPKIVIFHNIMSDKEIDVLKKLAHPRVSLQFYFRFSPFFSIMFFILKWETQC